LKKQLLRLLLFSQKIHLKQSKRRFNLELSRSNNIHSENHTTLLYTTVGSTTAMQKNTFHREQLLVLDVPTNKTQQKNSKTIQIVQQQKLKVNNEIKIFFRGIKINRN